MAFCERAEIVSVDPVSPSLHRVRLRAVGAWRWFETGTGDERIDLLFPFPGDLHADISYFNDLHVGVPRDDPAPPWRHYTVRSVRRGGRELDIDFVLHGEGVATEWVRSAEPGHTVGVFRGSAAPRAYYDPTETASWQLLVADATGMPGLARIIEELPAGMPVHAVVELPTAADRGYLPDHPQVDWTIVEARAGHASALPEAVERLALPSSPGYAWAACEASAARRIRAHLRTVRRMSRTEHRTIGYWTAGSAGHNEE